MMCVLLFGGNSFAIFGLFKHFCANFRHNCSLLVFNESKSHCGGRASSSTLPKFQLGDCQVNPALHAWLGVLGSLLVDFAVKFPSASAPCAVSTQVRLSPISSRPRLAALDSANLKMDLGRPEPESVKLPSFHSAN